MPNQLVGVSNLTVPSARGKVNKYFKTKFDLLYKKHENMLSIEKLYAVDKSMSTYTFVTTKEKFREEIVDAFSKFGVKIAGMTFQSAVLVDFALSKNKQLAKENFIVAYFGEYANFVAVSKGEVVCHQKLENEQNLFSKKYVSYIKTNYKNMSNDEREFEEKIEKLNEKSTKRALHYSKIQLYFDQFVENLKRSNLEFKCDKMVLIDNSAKKLQDFNFDGDIIYYVKIENPTLFLNATKNCFLEAKKGLF